MEKFRFVNTKREKAKLRGNSVFTGCFETNTLQRVGIV